MKLIKEVNLGYLQYKLGVNFFPKSSYNRYPKDSFYWYQKVIATNGKELE